VTTSAAGESRVTTRFPLRPHPPWSRIANRSRSMRDGTKNPTSPRSLVVGRSGLKMSSRARRFVSRHPTPPAYRPLRRPKNESLCRATAPPPRAMEDVRWVTTAPSPTDAPSGRREARPSSNTSRPCLLHPRDGRVRSVRMCVRGRQWRIVRSLAVESSGVVPAAPDRRPLLVVGVVHHHRAAPCRAGVPESGRVSVSKTKALPMSTARWFFAGSAVVAICLVRHSLPLRSRSLFRRSAIPPRAATMSLARRNRLPIESLLPTHWRRRSFRFTSHSRQPRARLRSGRRGCCSHESSRDPQILDKSSVTLGDRTPHSSELSRRAVPPFARLVDCRDETLPPGPPRCADDCLPVAHTGPILRDVLARSRFGARRPKLDRV